MLLCNILKKSLVVGLLVMGHQMGLAQEWRVVRENPQKAFPRTVPAGNYSGIAHLHDDVYAVVSDKSDSALYFNFRIQINPKTGDLERVENLGFTEYVDGSIHIESQDAGRCWNSVRSGYDHEAIAKVSDSTLVVASEGYYSLKEYPIIEKDSLKGHSTESKMNRLWEKSWNAKDFYPNYAFESLAFDTVHHCLWTIPESTLREDGEVATPENGLANKLRLMRFDWEDWVACAYLMDKPSTARKAETYVMGVSELCALPDGQLLVLEREAFIPKIKLGAFCKCKLYLINPWKEKMVPFEQMQDENTSFIEKRLLTEWKTGLSLFDRSFANYEGMCLGPKLEDGSQVIILLADSQDQYAGVLKDWFKTLVISNK